MSSQPEHPDFPVMLVRTARPVPGYTVTQPLGILYLGAELRRHGYRNLRLVDMRPGQMQVGELVGLIGSFRPRLLGLSCLSYEEPTVAEIAQEVRTLDPGIHIALGGPLPSSMKRESFERIDADSIAVGEGERSIVALVEGLSSGRFPPPGGAPCGVPGLAFRGQDGAAEVSEPGYIEDMDELPLPAWDLLDISRYFGISNFNFFLKHPKYMSVMTTRGCPYRCAYCHNVLGKKYRKRSVDHVMREIHALVGRGIGEIHIIDDSFNLDLERAKAILDEMAKIRPRLALAFPNGLRSDRLDEEFLVKAKAAGAYKINFAVETASERLQKKIRKNLDLEKVREMIAINDRLNIIGHGFFMLGFPSETEQEMRQTVDYALGSRLHTANFFVVQPFEGTDIYRMFRELHPEMFNEAGKFDYYQANFEIYEIPARRVQQIVKDAHRRFFLEPWRALKLLRLMPHKAALLQGAVRLAYRGFLGRG
jgi:anaerobic magnesium-protoporphyrin IX monomethyl ester cyclase